MHTFQKNLFAVINTSLLFLLFLCSTVHLTLCFPFMCGEIVLYFSTGDLSCFCILPHFPHCFMAVCFPSFSYVSPLLQTSSPSSFPHSFSFHILFWSLFCIYGHLFYSISFPCVLWDLSQLCKLLQHCSEISFLLL